MGDQTGHHLILGSLVVLRRVLDVDLPTGEPRRQTHVLTFPADRQTELVVGYEHMGMVPLGIHQAHHLHPGWTEGIGDVLAGVGRPADHVDLLAPQLIHHLLDAGAAGADAGPHRIHLPLHTVDGHLGAGTHRARGGIGFPGHGHNPH